MAKTDITLVIFDVDGTLLDTSEFIYQAYEHTLKEHGVPLQNRAVVGSIIGRKLEDCYAFLAPDTATDVLSATHRAFQDKNTTLVRPFEYCDEMLEALKKAGKKLAICTSRSRNIEESLAAGGIDPALFDYIVSAGMVQKAKPDPEGIMLAMQKLEVNPEYAVFVGDADVDMLAGRAAGVAITVGVTHGFGTRQALEAAEADHIIDAFEQLLPICGVSNGS